jgi:hypothetical protein
MKCTQCLESILYNGKEKSLTKKAGDKKYELSICEKCLIEKFPIYLEKNKSRIFNSWNELTKFAFQLSDDEFQMVKKKTYTREFSDEYRKKLSMKNTLQFHIEKYGEKGYDIYKSRCESRAVTFKNMIRRYGVKIGTEKWNSYKKKQSYSESLEYCLEKFGEKGYQIYKNRCKNKALSEERFLSKYGIEEGKKKWKEYRKKYIESFQRRTPFSKKANSFFSILKDVLPKGLTIYDFSNKEMCFISPQGNVAFSDFYIAELDIVIEYYGDFWHANPSLYEKDDHIHTCYRADDIWKRDEERLKIFGKTKVIVVWELEADDNKIKELKKIIENELRNRN